MAGALRHMAAFGAISARGQVTFLTAADRSPILDTVVFVGLVSWQRLETPAPEPVFGSRRLTWFRLDCTQLHPVLCDSHMGRSSAGAASYRALLTYQFIAGETAILYTFCMVCDRHVPWARAHGKKGGTGWVPDRTVGADRRPPRAVRCGHDAIRPLARSYRWACAVRHKKCGISCSFPRLCREAPLKFLRDVYLVGGIHLSPGSAGRLR